MAYESKDAYREFELEQMLQKTIFALQKAVFILDENSQFKTTEMKKLIDKAEKLLGETP